MEILFDKFKFIYYNLCYRTYNKFEKEDDLWQRKILTLKVMLSSLWEI